MLSEVKKSADQSTYMSQFRPVDPQGLPNPLLGHQTEAHRIANDPATWQSLDDWVPQGEPMDYMAGVHGERMFLLA